VPTDTSHSGQLLDRRQEFSRRDGTTVDLAQGDGDALVWVLWLLARNLRCCGGTGGWPRAIRENKLAAARWSDSDTHAT